MTFHGKPRADHHVMEHVHESPLVMLLPLGVLAFGAVFSGFVFYENFVGHHMAEFWGDSIFVREENNSVEKAHHVAAWVKYLPLGIGIAGIALGYLAYMFKPGLPERVAKTFRPVHALFFRKWYFDELYNRVFVRSAFVLGQAFWQSGDQNTIDRLGPNGVASLSGRFGALLSRFQSGYVFQYAFVMIIGIFCILAWFALKFRIFG
jgi:NADH-quinone oxidoreductase subunit L